MKLRRRDFNAGAATGAALLISGCGGGGSSDSSNPTSALPPAPAPAPGQAPAPAPAVGGTPAPAPVPGAPAPAPVPTAAAPIGSNLPGLELPVFNVRYGGGTQQNVDYTVPRRADVRWLASIGYTDVRLPILWEMLQPMLFDTNANAATRAIVGQPGEFNATYQAHIQSVLDECAAAGIKCVIDLHNYCRYKDFIYQPDGSVIGLVQPGGTIMPFTSDNSQVMERIFATAPGATLRPAHLSDFWVRVARLWKDHPGFGGYGLINEPYNMPAPGTTVATFDDGPQDLSIWPTFAQAAIDAIRAVDPAKDIYIDGNFWSAAFRYPEANPDFPLKGANLVYDVHMYLDAFTNGQSFDWDTEIAKGFTAGVGSVPIDADTGVKRLQIAVDWAKAHGNARIALMETGMPVDDPRWQEEFQRLADYARANGVEIFVWAGGNHWSFHNAGITNVPGWHENKTVESAMSGVMQRSASISFASVFADGPGYAAGGSPVTITLWSRGNLGSPATIAISSSNGGTLSASSVTLPAGANSEVSFTFTPAANTVSTLSFSVTSGSINAPLPHRVFSLTDPAAYAATSLPDAAMAILAKYSACKWEMADGYTDYLNGTPSAPGQEVRAIADSGYGSGPGNAMEMLNWLNVDRDLNFSVPVMREVGGHKCSDHTAGNSTGFWCRKVYPRAKIQPNPRNRIPYTVGDAHFAIAAINIPAARDGVIFQASRGDAAQVTELRVSGGKPQLHIVDENGTTATATAPAALAANAASVVTLASAPGSQQLRVNSQVAASAGQTFAASSLDQMLIAWGFQQYHTEASFGGYVFAVVTGRGAPTAAELAVLESYLASTAG